tara:strand:- start:155 stop:1189 length:1035 start_codon:yes stop_codon:yes gene_type:complete
MAGYKYGKNAVFGSGNTTTSLTGPTLVVGDSNTVSGSATSSLIAGDSNTLHENTEHDFIAGEGNQIESGSNECAVIGGSGNKIKASSGQSVILGGLLSNNSSTNSASRSVVLAGMINSMNGGTNSTVGGQLSVVGPECQNSFVYGNTNNVDCQEVSVIGNSNTIPNTMYRTVVVGSLATGASATYNLISGDSAFANIYGTHVHGGGMLSSVKGSVQFNHTLVACQTTDATQTTMKWAQNASPAQAIPIRANSSMMFRAEIVARRTSTQTESAAYEIVGCIKNDAGTTALEGSITKTVIAEADANWDVTAVANNTDDTLDIKVTGAAGKNINWVAKVTLVETNGA